jgi:formate-dependent nitrite reductase membrane component NrfD
VAVTGLEEWTRLFLIGFVIILIIYLLSIRYRGLAGKSSVREIVAGRWAPLFWVMVVALGMVLPLVVTLLSWTGGSAVPAALLYLVILFELLGDLSFRYCILKNGYYSPLIPTSSYAY